MRPGNPSPVVVSPPADRDAAGRRDAFIRRSRSPHLALGADSRLP